MATDRGENHDQGDGRLALPAGVPIDVFRDPPGFNEAIDYVTQHTQEASQDCHAVACQMCDELAAQVGVSATEVATLCRTLLGEVQTSLDNAEESLRKVADKIVKDVSDQLFYAASDIERSGAAYPFDHDVRTMLLDSPPVEWLPVVVPTFQQFFDPPPATVDCTKFPAAPGCGGPAGGGDPPFPCGEGDVLCPGTGGDPVITPGGEPVGYVCSDGLTVVSDPSLCPPWNPTAPQPPCDCPEPPPPPPPPPPPFPGQCPEQQCCGGPTDVDLTITGGNTTIVLPPPAAPLPPPPIPPTPSPPTCPDVEVNVSTKPPVIDIKLPPDEALMKAQRLFAPVNPTDNVTDWSTVDPCIGEASTLAALERRYRHDKPSQPAGAGSASGIFSAFVAPFMSFIPGKVENESDALTRVGASVLAAPAAFADGAWSTAYEAFELLAETQVKNRGAAKFYGGRLGMASWAQTISGFPISYLFQGELYAYQSANPQYIPGQIQVDQLYLNGLIQDSVWECWTKAHGNIPKWQRLVRDMQVGRPDVQQLIQLYLRKEITKEQLIERAAQRGWGNTSWLQDLLKLSIQLPTQTDLLRFMVRDSADDKVAEKYKYDQDFDIKFAGKVRDWAEAQGIPAEVFQYFWRAHWVIPSNTQLYEMFQRFRPDRPEVQNWDDVAATVGPQVATANLGPRPLVVTLDDVRQALQVNDQAPAWIDALIGIAYRPMTRTDAVRAFEIGVIDERQLYHRLRDNGYNQADADALTIFYVQQANRRASNATGVLTIRKIVKLFKAYAMTRREAEFELGRLIKEQQRVTDLLDGAERERVYEHQNKMIGIIRKRFMLGLETDERIIVDLGGQGVQDLDAATLIRRWAEEKRKVDKAPTAAQLCKWFKLRLITADEYRSRLLGMGYVLADVDRIMMDCVSKK